MITGEPCAGKPARTVRREAARKRTRTSGHLAARPTQQTDATHPDALAVTFAELEDVPTLITPKPTSELDRKEEVAAA